MILSTDQTPATPATPADGQPAAGAPPATESQPAAAAAPGADGSAPAGEPAKTEPNPAADPAVSLEDKPEPTPDPDTTHEFTYDPTGDASLDIALNYIGKLGYSPNHPAMLAAQKGDFNLIKAELAVKGVAGASEMLAVAQEGYQRVAGAQKAKDAETRNYGEQLCQGKENFNAALEWGRKTLSDADKAWFNSSVSQGGIAAQAAIDKLAQSYLAANKFTKHPANAAPGAAAAAGGFADNGPIDSATYRAEIQKLRVAAGNRGYEGSDQYKALQARRTAGMRAGLQ